MQIVNDGIEDYIRGLLVRYDEPVLLDMEAHAAEHGFPIVGRMCGVTIEMLTRAVSAQRVFELGSGFGYSAYWFARATGPAGEIHLTDGDAANEVKARGYLSRSGAWDRVTFHVGDALTSFAEVDGNFDVVYCDVDKTGYPDCWRAACDRIRIGGLWMCDNTLWSGRVLDADRDENTLAIDEHNRLVASDDRYVSIIVPLRDGLLCALRVS
jgi:caffeoyl-CoA O-methyltransferase